MLTQEQVEHLFRFTKKKHVHYYDVQVELVDHLASSIEEEMEKDPKVSFEEALQIVYKRFGIFGFTHVVQEKQQAVAKMNNRIWKSAFKSFFTVPKIFFTLCIFAVAFYIGKFLSPELRYMVFAAIWVIFQAAEFYNRIKRKPNKGKPLLLTQATAYFSGSNLFLWYVIIADEIKTNLLFALLTAGAIVSQLAFIEVVRYLHKEATVLYPQAFARS